MLIRIILAIVVVFFLWAALDFVVHGLILQPAYEQTAELWRPMDEMNMPLMYVVTLARAVCFVLIFGLLVAKKSPATGILYGVLFGLAVGIPMGFGSYTTMPIPLQLAIGWCLGVIVGAIAAGGLLGVIVTPKKAAA